MGNVASMAMRKARRFNVENRAQRVLDQEKPTVAPTFEANVRDLQKVLDENPDWVKEQGKKSIALDDRLKQVYVTSTEPEVQPLVRPGETNEPTETLSGDSIARALPLDRKAVDDFEYGYKEPQKITRGRITLRQAIKFIGEHQQGPEKWTAAHIANEYKMKESVVADILRNFHTFEVYIPDVKSKENVLISKTNNKLLASEMSEYQKRSEQETFDAMEKRFEDLKPPKQ